MSKSQSTTDGLITEGEITFQRVELIWHDAHTLSATWMHIDEIDEEPCVVATIGYLIPDSKPDHIVVAQSVNSIDHLDSVIAVPVAMVKKLTTLG